VAGERPAVDRPPQLRCSPRRAQGVTLGPFGIKVLRIVGRGQPPGERNGTYGRSGIAVDHIRPEVSDAM
jgi:hypothetical protein